MAQLVIVIVSLQLTAHWKCFFTYIVFFKQLNFFSEMHALAGQMLIIMISRQNFEIILISFLEITFCTKQKEVNNSDLVSAAMQQDLELMFCWDFPDFISPS